jgi:hypothetical protein
VLKYHGITHIPYHTCGYLPLTAQKGMIIYQRRPLVSESIPFAEQCRILRYFQISNRRTISSHSNKKINSHNITFQHTNPKHLPYQKEKKSNSVFFSWPAPAHSPPSPIPTTTSDELNPSPTPIHAPPTFIHVNPIG